MLYDIMKDDFEESLDAHSEWVYLKQSMDQSLITTSQKVYIDNASKLNREELEKDKKIMNAQEQAQESQNEFMDVGKWRKNKQSSQQDEMKAVGEKVQQIITQTKWHKQPKAHEAQTTLINKSKQHSKENKKQEKEEIIADESLVVPADSQEDQIQDQTQKQQEQSEQDNEQQQEQQQQEEQEQEQQQEESSEEEQEQEDEQQEQQQQQQEQQSEESEEQNAQQQPQAKQESNLSLSHDEDKTDTKSEMKATQYLPSNWPKKRQSQQTIVPESWKAKQIILMRIVKLLQ